MRYREGVRILIKHETEAEIPLATRVETQLDKERYRTLMALLVERCVDHGILTETELRKLHVLHTGESLHRSRYP